MEKKGRKGEAKGKLFNFRMKEELMEQVDAYWGRTKRFGNRSEFLTHLVQLELVERRLLGDKMALESTKVMQRLTELEEKLSTMEKERWNLLNNFLTTISSIEDKFHALSLDADSGKEFGIEVFSLIRNVFSNFLSANIT